MTCLHPQTYNPCFTVTIVLKMERKQGRKSSLGSGWKGGRERRKMRRGRRRGRRKQEFSTEGYQQADPRQQGDKKRLQRTSEEPGEACLDFCSMLKKQIKRRKKEIHIFSVRTQSSGQALAALSVGSSEATALGEELSESLRTSSHQGIVNLPISSA